MTLEIIEKMNHRMLEIENVGHPTLRLWGSIKDELEKLDSMKTILDRFFAENAAESNLEDYALCYSTLGVLHDRSNGILTEHEISISPNEVGREE